MKRRLIFCACLLLGACSKDKTTMNPNNNNGNNNQPTKTPKELIVGTWEMTSVMFSGTESITDCNKDNLITYRTDGTYTLDQGTVKCNPNALQTDDGTWNLDNYPTFKAKLNSATSEGTIVTIKTLDNSTMNYEQTEGGQTYSITWKRQ